MTNKLVTYLLIASALLLNMDIFAQKSTSEAVFSPPIDIPIYLSGSFGELRSNHFHAGIDIKTQGVEGLEVMAIADGYVSRIKISSGGYGKAIYITHPNGYVSVYAHLKKFNKHIQHFIKELQYKKERFAVETFPEKGVLTVRKGEVIAFSGNTGSSSGPHLHFEIREEGTQYPVNPLFFEGIVIKDKISPRIEELGIYPLNEQTLINGKNDTAYISVEKQGGKYGLSNKKKISVSGSFSLGIRTYDQMNEISNKNGVYQIELNLDNEMVYALEMDRLSFSTVRYINSLIDYSYYKSKKRRLIRTQIDTNNRLFNYRDVSNNGIFAFVDSLTHDFTYRVSDAYNNSSALSFSIESVLLENNPNSIKKLHQNGESFEFTKDNKIGEKGISLSFPANTFYRSLYFQLKTLPGTENTFAPIFKVHNKYTPVQKHFTIKLTPDTIPDRLKNKMFIGVLNDEGQYYYIGSSWEGNTLTTKSRLLGNYSVFADTIPPTIKSVNFSDGKNVNAQNTLKVKISDQQTGIKYYRAELNGQWILMEYDAKRSLLTYHYDERIRKGENNIELVVKDLLDNETSYNATIFR